MPTFTYPKSKTLVLWIVFTLSLFTLHRRPLEGSGEKVKMGSDQRCPHPNVFGHLSFVKHFNLSVLECPEKNGRLQEKL